MAAPNITVRTVVEEGLKRAGFSSPSAGQIKRAQEIWLPEVVGEIVNAARQSGIGVLKVFETTALAIGKTNQSRYALPNDYDDELSVLILDGGTSGTAQAGDVQTATLAAAEDITASDAEGRSLLFTSGVAKGQLRQITDYDATTKVATVDVAWDAGKTPVSGDTYVVVDEKTCVEVEWVRTVDQLAANDTPGTPTRVAIYNNEFIFDRPLDKAYGLRLRYYADPVKIDMSEARWTDMFTRWQRLLTLGIQRLAMDENDDDRTKEIKADFSAALSGAIFRDQPEYGEFEGFTI